MRAAEERGAPADDIMADFPLVGGGPLDKLAEEAGPQRVIVLIEGGDFLVVERRAVDGGRPS